MNNDIVGQFKSLPPVTKNLLIINILFFLGKGVAESQGINLTSMLGLFYPTNPNFAPYQIITHMFMHGGLTHIFMNMYGLWLFGKVVEHTMGSQKFFIYYMVCGLGSAFLATAANGILSFQQLGNLLPDLATVSYTPALQPLYGVMVGASGAIYGIVLAYAWFNPNRMLQFIFVPFPFKAINLIKGLFVFDLLGGLNNTFFHIFPSTGFAHFAHLGGLIFGFILLKIWKLGAR